MGLKLLWSDNVELNIRIRGMNFCSPSSYVVASFADNLARFHSIREKDGEFRVTRRHLGALLS